MAQKWIRILAILVFCQKMASRAEGKVVNEGENVEIACKAPQLASTIMWFRVLDNSGMEFITSFDKDGKLKRPNSLPAKFSDQNMAKSILTLKSFQKATDSGVYSCAIISSSALQFGPTTRLRGKDEPTTKPPQVVTTKRSTTATPKPCVCGNGKGDVPCSMIILGPLAGGCGLLLLLLIVTIVYCNHTRTRRCPHHYKRKPRTAPGKQPMVTGRYV